MNDSYLIVWNSGNPSTYITKCNSLEDVKKFIIKTLGCDSEEYGLYVIRLSDGWVATINDQDIMDFQLPSSFS